MSDNPEAHRPITPDGWELVFGVIEGTKLDVPRIRAEVARLQALAQQAAPPAAQAEPGCLAPVCGGVPAEPCDVCPTAAQAGDELPPTDNAAFLADKSPGSEWHLTMLMAPYHLNLVVGSDRQHLLAWGRDVWNAARGAQAEPAGDEREAFEAWAGANQFDTHRDESDKYRDYHRATTRWAWQAWQARAALKGQPE
jgi:hypothetical protein